MDTVGDVDGTVVFLAHFEDLRNPRQQGKVIYWLDGILLPSLVAVLAGADGFADIARFGKKKLAFDTPSHDRLRNVFAMLDPVAFRRCFVAWTYRLVGLPEEMIAIDGNTSRRSCSRKQGANPVRIAHRCRSGRAGIRRRRRSPVRVPLSRRLPRPRSVRAAAIWSSDAWPFSKPPRPAAVGRNTSPAPSGSRRP